MTHTDLKLLQILLSLPLGKLSVSEQSAFQAMYDQLKMGKIVGLSRKQRSWADTVFLKLGLHKVALPPIKNVPVKDKFQVELDTGPKVLKPPGVKQ